MPDGITGPASSATTGAAGSATSASSKIAAGMALDRDAFMKLLVTQLRYQDPNAPVDTSQFMSQTAQFTMVDKLAALETSQQRLLNSQLVLGATGLVGRTVSYVNGAGDTVTGVVRSASFTGSSPTLRVGDMDVPLSSVTEVRTPAG